MSITKTGTWTNQQITNYFLQYIKYPTYITEPDGSQWLHICHHNDPATARFNSTDTFASGVYLDENRWFNVNLCNNFSKWEIMIKQKTTVEATEQKFRWIQTVNPMIATFNDTVAENTTFITTTGYTTPNSTYGGMYKNSGSSYLVCNNSKSGNWYGAIGCYTLYNGGIPGYNGTTITTGYTDVYIRVDNDSLNLEKMAKIRNTQELVFHDFIEI